MITDQLSAAERAAHRWWKIPLPETETARHERLIAALRNIDPMPVARTHELWRPGAKWRYLRFEYESQMITARCRRCKGTGELTVDDGAGGVDFESCHHCDRRNPYRLVEPRDVTAF